MTTIYFKNLNGLRFFAAAMVLVSHIEQIRLLRGMGSLFNHPLFSSLGKLGVIFFFVLSGFLITYLLIDEKEKSPEQHISFKNFYMRRILRIWPLYFMIVILGLFVLPAAGLYEFSSEELFQNYPTGIVVLLFLCFLPNVVLVLFGGLPFLHQTWSIGTEEQFYLIWPFVIRYSKKLLHTLIFIMAGYMALRFVLYAYKSNHTIYQLYSIWSTLSVLSLSLGGLCAYLCRYRREQVFRFTRSWFWQLFAVFFFLVMSYFSQWIPSMIRFDVFSLFFAYWILSLASSNVTTFLEWPVLNYFGKISYGIYMWHPIAISLCLWGLSSFAENSLVLYTASFMVSIGIAALSYELIEKRFLKLKKRYSSLSAGQ